MNRTNLPGLKSREASLLRETGDENVTWICKELDRWQSQHLILRLKVGGFWSTLTARGKRKMIADRNNTLEYHLLKTQYISPWRLHHAGSKKKKEIITNFSNRSRNCCVSLRRNFRSTNEQQCWEKERNNGNQLNDFWPDLLLQFRVITPYANGGLPPSISGPKVCVNFTPLPRQPRNWINAIVRVYLQHYIT